MKKPYPLYRPEIPNSVVFHEIYQQIPFTGISNKQLSKNFSLKEAVDAAFVRGFEKSQFTRIPIDPRVILASQAIRDALNKPIKLGSTFRSMEWEFYRKRPGTSRHTYGMAWDLSGDGLVKMMTEAVNTKNELYRRLKQIGIGFIQIYPYSNFVHIDTRPNNTQDIQVVFEKKKGSGLDKIALMDALSFVAVLVTIVTPLFALGNYLYNRFKKK
ncbi:D-Ala-D-Ala carboxypeptidase family metallohydrolase [Tenacibaculum jejuense]|uniref:Peptidase M15A C-terminal domain-containing protein n=1 Tax=Tenacibaculum jejuense TaxID=584609 RepID=A0A238U9C5_9FLAO|nr:D-Ala-D-Ala carboxypeptidase family metallohydrolase [Tenacibaculum jejuense]SNR15803.1 protein of unknown function [Tenacibaculum jejuense]